MVAKLLKLPSRVVGCGEGGLRGAERHADDRDRGDPRGGPGVVASATTKRPVTLDRDAVPVGEHLLPDDQDEDDGEEQQTGLARAEVEAAEVFGLS